MVALCGGMAFTERWVWMLAVGMQDTRQHLLMQRLFFFSVGGLGLGFVRNSTWVGGWVVMVVHMWVGPVVVGGSTANSDAKNTTAFVAVGLS